MLVFRGVTQTKKNIPFLWSSKKPRSIRDAHVQRCKNRRVHSDLRQEICTVDDSEIRETTTWDGAKTL